MHGWAPPHQRQAPSPACLFSKVPGLHRRCRETVCNHHRRFLSHLRRRAAQRARVQQVQGEAGAGKAQRIKRCSARLREGILRGAGAPRCWQVADAIKRAPAHSTGQTVPTAPCGKRPGHFAPGELSGRSAACTAGSLAAEMARLVENALHAAHTANSGRCSIADGKVEECPSMCGSAPQGPLQGCDRKTETAAAALPPPRCSTSAGPQQRSGSCQQQGMLQAWDAAGRPYGSPAPGPAWAEAPPAVVKTHGSGTERDEEAEEEGSLLAFVESLDYESFAKQLAALEAEACQDRAELPPSASCRPDAGACLDVGSAPGAGSLQHATTTAALVDDGRHAVVPSLGAPGGREGTRGQEGTRVGALSHRAPAAAFAVGDKARSTADAAELLAAAGCALTSDWDPSVRAGVHASRAASERGGSQAAACAGSALRSCPALHHVHSRRSVAALLGSMKLQAQG